MLNVGVKVVRGPYWSFGNDDGGEGYAGIVREVDSRKKIVTVQWDNGNLIQCRVGYLDKYDLRAIDNAQIGIKHKHVICDGCNEKNIFGMRYKCLHCYDYDLCYLCYHGDKHDTNHPFKRIETPKSNGVYLPPREGSRKCELRGIFSDAEVIRGADWEWGNQDGGQGKLGIVLYASGWKDLSARSTVYVQWLHGNSELYRLGHKGYCDVKFVTPSSGGHYYPDHLPILGQTEEQMDLNRILDTIEIQQVMEVEAVTAELASCKVSDVVQQLTVQNNSTLPLRTVESAYFSKIEKYNNDPANVDLFSEFLDVADEFHNTHVQEALEIMKYVTKLPNVSYTEDIIEKRYSDEFIKAMVAYVKKNLENSYKAYMLTIVNNSTSLGLTSNKADSYKLVHNFVAIRFQGEYLGFLDGTVEDCPLWAMVYYCLRIGDLSTAIYCLQETAPQFRELINILKTKLKTPDAPYVVHLEEELKFYFNDVVKNQTDPFKKAVWAVLSGSNKLSEVIQTADDYLWFNTHFIRVAVSQELAHLQREILQTNQESYLDSLDKRLEYFKLLALTGQFEAAVHFLYQIESLKIHAVHIALALNQMNLLAISRNKSAPLISYDVFETRPVRCLSLYHIVKEYVAKFETDCLNRGLHYFFLMRNCFNENCRGFFENFICETIVNTKEYVRIFGRLETDGSHTKGLLDQFVNSQITVESICKILIENDFYENALNLNTALNRNTYILNVICEILSKAVSSEQLTSSLISKLREELIKFAEQSLSTCSLELAQMYTKVKGLVTFFELYYTKMYREALEEVKALEILPFRQEEIDECLEKMDDLDDDLCELIPDVLLVTMTILLAQCDKARKRRGHIGKTAQIHKIQKQTRYLTSFAEKLPHEFKRVNHKLLQIDHIICTSASPAHYF